MGLVQFLPYVLLFAVGLWLVWPVWVEPNLRRIKARRRPEAASADDVAESLFGVWNDHGSEPGLIEPTKQ